jgi:mannose-1-phosphate guanylyltransferase/phosphomannomutase
MEHTEGKNRQLIDGARFQENGSWVWIAPSRNEAYFTIFAESENQSAAESLAQDYERQVRKWQEPTS